MPNDSKNPLWNSILGLPVDDEVNFILMSAYEHGVINPAPSGDTEHCEYCEGSGWLSWIPCPFCGGDEQWK